mmetsp:Transcript_76611/g.183544  ORF Transcript_76611/g.183544 Transcript_76611/m.183544 type:complete len:240 (-) Transcript_76611:1907-2626(-)
MTSLCSSALELAHASSDLGVQLLHFGCSCAKLRLQIGNDEAIVVVPKLPLFQASFIHFGLELLHFFAVPGRSMHQVCSQSRDCVVAVLDHGAQRLGLFEVGSRLLSLVHRFHLGFQVQDPCAERDELPHLVLWEGTTRPACPELCSQPPALLRSRLQLCRSCCSLSLALRHCLRSLGLHAAQAGFLLLEQGLHLRHVGLSCLALPAVAFCTPCVQLGLEGGLLHRSEGGLALLLLHLCA